MQTIEKEPMGNGYDYFVCPKCGHDNPIVFVSHSMQMLADMADKLNCESCGETFKVAQQERRVATMKEQFDEFHDAYPVVMAMFLMFTDELRKVGIIKIRADEVLHRVRWALITNGEEYLSNRLKTLYGNRYAMELMTKDSDYKGFFDLTVAHDDQ